MADREDSECHLQRLYYYYWCSLFTALRTNQESFRLKCIQSLSFNYKVRIHWQIQMHVNERNAILSRAQLRHNIRVNSWHCDDMQQTNCTGEMQNKNMKQRQSQMCFSISSFIIQPKKRERKRVTKRAIILKDFLMQICGTNKINKTATFQINTLSNYSQFII